MGCEGLLPGSAVAMTLPNIVGLEQAHSGRRPVARAPTGSEPKAPGERRPVPAGWRFGVAWFHDHSER